MPPLHRYRFAAVLAAVVVSVLLPDTLKRVEKRR
jgi:hypothetical protein